MPQTADARKTVMFVLPHLRTGGIEFVVRALVNGMDRSHWQPILCLSTAEGDLLRGVAPDVKVIDGGGRRASRLAPFLVRQIRAERPDVVYSGTNAVNMAALVAMLFLPRRARPRLIISEHSNYKGGIRIKPWRRKLLAWLYPKADLLVAPLEAVAREWQDRLSIHHPPVAELPNPVYSPDRYAALAANPPPRGEYRVITAGRLIPQKGQADLIRAFRTVHDARPEARLDLFGDGAARDDLQALIDKLGLTEVARLRGHTDNLPEEMARAHLFVLPSHREGFGNVLIEALAAGTDVVSTDCLGPRTILAGTGRRLVPVGDPDALAAEILSRFAQPLDAAAMAANRAIAEPYEIPRAVAAFERCLTHVLSDDAHR